MNQKGLHIYLTGILVLIVMFANGQAQVKSSVDRNSILVGERVKLSLEAYMPLGEKFSWFFLDTIPHFSILERGRPDTTETFDSKKIVQELTITSFDSGKWVMPSFEMLIGNVRYQTDTIEVGVGYSPFNREEDYRDIKEIVEVEDAGSRWIPWAIGVITFLALAATWWFMRRKKSIPQVTPQPILSPYEEAMKALEELKKKGIAHNGTVKAYYSELNTILRVYLSRKYPGGGLDKTNSELMRELKVHQPSADHYRQLEEALNIADYVKFAKYHPEEELQKQSFEIIKNTIQSLNSR